MISKLMVIVPDRLSDILNKGEVIDRYYNPGDLFDEVHVVLTNDDRPNPSDVSSMAGRARVYVHNLPTGRWLFVRSCGWRPYLLRSWLISAVELARRIQPLLVRCHGAQLNSFAAMGIKNALNVPYIVSLHTKPDEYLGASPKERLHRIALERVSREGLRHADRVVAVYEGITPYLKRIGLRSWDIAYNVLNPRELGEKCDYRLHQPVKLISVGRQIAGKNPENIIRAVQHLNDVHLTLVGTGSLHSRLLELVEPNQLESKIEFVPALSNDALCRMLPEFDAFVVHNEYSGIPKAVLEALLSGLPVVANRPRSASVPELSGSNCLFVDDSVEGYRSGLEKLISDNGLRERLGRQAYQEAQHRWAPEKTEARYVELYEKTLLRTLANRKLSYRTGI